MYTEFEITFTAVDPESIKNKIQALGGICTKPRTLMRRVVFSHPSSADSYLRVRDEWDRITTTYKYFTPGDLTIESVQEIECIVSDFDSMRDIYSAMWLREKAYQETYREVWQIWDEIEFMIDEWPGLRPFVEIEGENEAVVRRYTTLLGFQYEDGLFGAVDQIYLRELGIPCTVLNEDTPVITFDNPPQPYQIDVFLFKHTIISL